MCTRGYLAPIVQNSWRWIVMLKSAEEKWPPWMRTHKHVVFICIHRNSHQYVQLPSKSYLLYTNYIFRSLIYVSNMFQMFSRKSHKNHDIYPMFSLLTSRAQQCHAGFSGMPNGSSCLGTHGHPSGSRFVIPHRIIQWWMTSGSSRNPHIHPG